MRGESGERTTRECAHVKAESHVMQGPTGPGAEIRGLVVVVVVVVVVVIRVIVILVVVKGSSTVRARLNTSEQLIRHA